MNFIKSSLLLMLCGFTVAGQAQKKAAPTYSTNKLIIDRGDALFQKNCAECHNFRQRGIGPVLSGVTADASYTYLSKFIVNSQAVIKSGNKRAVALFAEYKIPMPAHPQLKPAEINALLSFINTHKKAAEVYVNTAELGAPVKDPIPTKIAKAGLTLKLEEWATAPATSTKKPLTRINQTYVLKTPTGNRLFMLDLRGKLYEIKDKQFNVVMDMAKEKPKFIHEPGLASGWGTFVFHPDFLKNGLLYTTHTEKKGSAPADFAYADSIPVALQWVVTEWKVKDPAAAVFEATPREMIRMDNPSAMHGMQQMIFDPTLKPGMPGYGLLYLDFGDGGSGELGYPWLCNGSTEPRGSILRIDPMGRNSRNGKYGIPASNPRAKTGDPTVLGEVYARGFRNPNKITRAPDGKVIVSEIGYTNVEELNILKPGLNYGWPTREGTFVSVLAGKKSAIYNLPAHDDPKYTYPVAQYDHDEGNSVAGGFVYTGDIAALKGKYIFGDIVKGRVFYVELADLKLGQQAVIKEFDLQFGDLKTTYPQLVKNPKTDMRFGLGENNAFYIWAKTDGKIWQIKDCVTN
ncbi:c-type cytochrome [Mucilaginibacter sp. S1162]|uniref:C-type cytochrome n=1 Tax=Mucilaginibacter humi TaxID=2732510 RepID=A0ABX1VZ16_9SPHI|nr:PQQ-dependent sugar dehydrogenase [Mucilaginibacter humi]NNU33207.1 c-type cytochrome [Mucilaginibacter humi]